MVLFYATNAILEVSAGVAWWLTTKTASGLYNGISYMIYGNTELTDEQKKEIMVIDFEDEDNKEQMNQLLNEIKSLRNEIIDLKKNK